MCIFRISERDFCEVEFTLGCFLFLFLTGVILNMPLSPDQGGKDFDLKVNEDKQDAHPFIAACAV